MSRKRLLRIYLEKDLRARAEAGDHNYFNRLSAALQGVGYRVSYARNSASERLKSVGRQGYALFHMDEPFHPFALTTRKAGILPFWRIEDSAARWEWEIAGKRFDPAEIDAGAAARFTGNWRKWLFDLSEDEITREKMIFAPLQGRLLERRSFQAASPLEMLQLTLSAHPGHTVVATLHPGEEYSDAERRALVELAAQHPRLSLGQEPMAAYLGTCDFVVTENSTVGLLAHFFGKATVLFARIDHHHASANVLEMGAEAALGAGPQMAPPHDAYLYWYLQLNSINAGRPEAEAQILARLAALGWPVDPPGGGA